MLSHEAAKKSFKNMTVDIWADEELDLIAAELKRLFPNKGYGYFHGLQFTPEEVEEAAETVLPQHRHKSVMDYQDIRRPMFNAFARISRPQVDRPKLSIVPGSVSITGGIRWSPQEWEAVILELHRVCPKAFEERLKNVNMPAVRIAMEVLDIPRRRHFKQIVGFKEQALKMWDDMPEEIKNPAKAERVIIDFETGPVMAPAVTKETKEKPMAAALQKAFVSAQEENDKKERKNYVHWNSAEWLAVAREMYRQNPFANFLISGFFTIDLPAIREAQRVLPINRRRRITGTAGLQKPLVEAFKMLSQELAEQEDVTRHANDLLVKDEEIDPDSFKAKGLEPIPVAQEIPTPPVAVEAPEPVKSAAPVETPAFVPLSGREMDFFAKVLNAALPLMNVLIDEAVSRLAPTLISGLMPQLEKSLSGMIERAVTAQIPQTTAAVAPVFSTVFDVQDETKTAQEAPKPLSKAELQQFLPQPAEKPKKAKIALLMPSGSQREQIRSAFREYDFLFIDRGQGIKEAGLSCVLFVAVNAYVNEANRNNIKAHIPPEKLKYVDGGITSIKRQIRIWQASQTLTHV